MKRIFLLVLFVFLIVGVAQTKANTCPFTIEMEIGTKHEQVTLLQDFMKKVLLIYEGPTTGYFGGLSSNAIKVFQKNSGLLETGLFDSVTKSVFCQIYSSYNTDKNIAVPSQSVTGECFVKTLGLARGYFDKPADEVVELQKYLNQKGFYPENIVSGYFGILTEVALKKFQASVGIANTGIVDNPTFKAICGYESSQVIGCPFVTNNLSAGYFEEASNEVKALQMVLVKLNLLDKQYQTGFYGKITADAVKKFQEKVNLSQTGILNIETRAALCELVGMPLADGESKSDNPKQTASSKVDIAISGVSIPVEKIDVDTKVPIIVRAKNIGSEKSTKFKSAIYMDDKLDATVETYELNPEQETIVMAHTWTCKQKGIYALKIFLDHDNQLIEQNKFNNVLVVPINCGNVKQEDFKYSCDTTKYQCVVSDKGTMLKEECEKTCKKETEADLPDLTVIEFKPNKTNVKVGEKITLSITEKNIGKTDAPVHQVKMLINKEESLANWPALGVGKQNINDTLEWVCNTAGTYTFTFTTNSDNKIKELSTTNNSRSFEIRCGAESSGGIFGDDGQGNQGGGTPPGGGQPPQGGGQKEGGGSEPTDPNLKKVSGKLMLNWFTVRPVDTYNCPFARCGAASENSFLCKLYGISLLKNIYGEMVPVACGRNDVTGSAMDTPFLREAPHKVNVGFHVDNRNHENKLDWKDKKTECYIDMGDGKKIDCSFKGLLYSGELRNEEKGFTGFDYIYDNATNKPITVCPTIVVIDPETGDKITSKSMSTYCDSFCKEGQEDKTKCLVIYPRGWAFMDKEVTGRTQNYSFAWVRPSSDHPVVKEKIHFDYLINYIHSNDMAWCKMNIKMYNPNKPVGSEDFIWSSYKFFECRSSGRIDYTFEQAGNYQLSFAVGHSLKNLYGSSAINIQVFEDAGKGATCNEETCFVCDPKKTESDKCVSMIKFEYTKEENKNLERYFTQQECKDKCKVVPSDDKKTLSCSVTGKLLPDILMPKFSSLVVGAEAKIEEKEKCNSWEYSWKNNFTFDQWTAYEKSNSKNFAKSIGLTENIKKDIVFTTKVRAKCGTTQLESECTFTIDKNGVVKPLSQNIVDENSIVAETTVKENWFTNLITNIFKTTENNQDLTASKSNDLTIQSEKKYTCKSGTCVEASFGGTSLSECMKGCFSATFSNLFEGLISTVSTTKPTTAINLDTSKLSIPGFDNLITSNTTKPLTTFNFDNINFDFTGFNFTDQKPKTKEITTMPVHNFDNLINNFSSTNTYQAVKYKCNNNTGKCIIANNLDKNTYLSENECNKNCYTVSSFNTINSINSFNQFNLQTNQ